MPAGAPCCRLVASHQPTRRTSRYPTDLTDSRWAELDPLDNGIEWRALPVDFPPWPTVYKRFAAWGKVGASQRLLDALRDRVRLVEGRVAAPSAAVVDSQSVRAAATVGKATRGWDDAKKVAGRKRHVVVDTTGLLSAVLATPASTQDRVAARSLLRRMRDTAGGRVSLLWADGAYTGPLIDWARRTLRLVVEIVQRPQVPYFTVLPRRWVVERTLCLDRRTPPLRPRLRTTTPPPRGRGQLVHDPHHQPPTHPTPMARKQLLTPLSPCCCRRGPR